MNLYFIYRTDNIGYDQFDSAVVCAGSHDQALRVDPSTSEILTAEELGAIRYRDWAYSFDDVRVEYIGELSPDLDYPAGYVICASYNAG